MNNTITLSDMELQIVLAALNEVRKSAATERGMSADIGRRTIGETIDNLMRQVRPAFVNPL